MIKWLWNIILKGLSCNVYFGKPLAGVRDRAIVFFPYHGNRLSCGLTGIVAIAKRPGGVLSFPNHFFENQDLPVIAVHKVDFQGRREIIFGDGGISGVLIHPGIAFQIELR